MMRLTPRACSLSMVLLAIVMVLLAIVRPTILPMRYCDFEFANPRQ